VPVYPQHIAEAIREPVSCRSIGEANAMGSEAKFDCGCFIRFEMSIDGDDSRIREIGYRSNGCGYMIATAETLAAKLSGGSLLDLRGRLEADPCDRLECAQAAVNAIKNAFANYRSSRLEEFRGEKALICTCFGVAEETIEQFVKTRHPHDVIEVSDALRAGSGCGSCRMLIREIIDANG
jgi:NifU-like protein involved in Fe-S cluster formation/bacterioferritin-associated ferredoxin